ncbi:TetR/AcrR family transcriptional regulator [Teichococcus aestuarii]|uniref:TetR family transcriptional regulator n=1 Tax=Teichococcus aestuarii TaxID=568898 RepID=A0A2U1UY75_9PROT|nr:TetR/AcrR family transcriptional regulator [Pseudoroseomonas aestuarii]PWC26603.1 TetR family transcriptional regulator [Pseudoroseomonas aestuarii]
MRADAKKNHDHLLAVARDLLSAGGADASLRDIARTAGVGLGTLYRHFPTREALLEALLRSSFDALTVRAGDLEASDTPGAALVTWLRETVAVASNYSGAIKSMVAAIEDETSALHASCVAMKAAGTRLLGRAQAAKEARADMDGADLFAFVGALSWVADQPALASRSDHIFGIIVDAILISPGASKLPKLG